jgi:hypothetical protein
LRLPLYVLSVVDAKSTDRQTGLETLPGFSLKNRMLFEIQIVIVKLIIFNSNAKQEEV